MTRPWKLLTRWRAQFCYESVLVSISIFSILYGARILIVGGVFRPPISIALDSLLLIERAIPIDHIALILMLAGGVSLFAVYADYRVAGWVSLYMLLAIWVMLSISFLSLSLLSVNALISSYMAVLYSWVIWRTRGWTSPTS